MLQLNSIEPKWVIIENIVSNSSVRKCHHRDTMFVAEVIHEQSTGLVDIHTKEVYPCAFNNRQFSDEASAKKYIGRYFKDERNALISMLTTIDKFADINPEVMI